MFVRDKWCWGRIGLSLVAFLLAVGGGEAWACHTWAPIHGDYEINKHITYNTFEWGDQINFYQYTQNPTYEHETLVMNKDFADELSIFSKDLWNSNLPCAYRDVLNQFDPVDNFAVGSTCAGNIAPTVPYYVYINLRPVAGGPETSGAYISGQLGYGGGPKLGAIFKIASTFGTGENNNCRRLKDRFTVPSSGSWVQPQNSPHKKKGKK